MDTCLFSGDDLNSSTKVEHTIPESLGGRVTSRRVTSSCFNEKWGNITIAALKAPYALLMNKLGPLLPTAHKTRLIQIDVAGEVPGLSLDKEGVMTREGFQVAARDPVTKRPRAFVGTDEKGMRKNIRQLGVKDDQITKSILPATTANHFLMGKVPIISAEIELASLIATLLTFDELLYGSPNRFTRSVEFAPIRKFVWSAVKNGSFGDSKKLSCYSLGLQYENLPKLLKLRDQVSHPKSAFEHVLFASANFATRTVDLVWLVHGFDPHGFRVHDWQGGSFTHVIVNGILKDTTCSGLVEIPTSSLLCRPTNRCAFREKALSQQEGEAILNEISKKRLEACEKAVYLVEMTADDFIIEMLKNAGNIIGGNTPLKEIVIHRLCGRYGRKANDSGFKDEIEQIVNSHLNSLPKAKSEQCYSVEDESNVVEWDVWLAFYRKCLDEVVSWYGNPGDGFIDNTGMVNESVNSRKLGRLPDVSN